MEQGHKLDETFAFFLNEKLDRIILSNPRTRDGYVKLILRPLILQGRLKFQAEEFTEKQAFHKNMSAREAAEYLKDQLSKLYRNGEIFSLLGSGTILVGKKGTVTVKIKKKVVLAAPDKNRQNEGGGYQPGGSGQAEPPQPREALRAAGRDACSLPGGSGSNDEGRSGGKSQVR